MIKKLINKKFSFLQLLAVVIIFGIIEAGCFGFFLKDSKIVKESHFRQRNLSSTKSTTFNDFGINSGETQIDRQVIRSSSREKAADKANDDKIGPRGLFECVLNDHWYPGGYRIGQLICVSREEGWKHSSEEIKPGSIRQPGLTPPPDDDSCFHNNYWYPRGYRMGPYLCHLERKWVYDP